MRRFIRILTLTLVTLCGIGSVQAWPGFLQYNMAMRRGGAKVFKDPTLRGGTLTRTGFDLLYLPGGAAAVYQLTDANGKKWAVRVFTKEPKHDRHAAIAETITAVGKKSGLFPQVEYLADGIEVEEKGVKKTYPVVKMEWVEGEKLEAHVESLLKAKQAAKVDELAEQWRAAHATLRKGGMGHGDLQHNNILVTAKGKLQLIDFDDVHIQGKKNGDHGHGHPMYAHPSRGADDHYMDIDNFPSLLIYTSLKAVAADPSLWHDGDIHLADNNGGGDNLIFQPEDFRDPARSKVFKRLAASPSAQVRALGAKIVELLDKHVSEVPPLEALLGKEEWTPDGKLPNGKKPSGKFAPLSAPRATKAAAVEPEEEPVAKTTKKGGAASTAADKKAATSDGKPGPNATAAEWQVYRMKQLRGR